MGRTQKVFNLPFKPNGEPIIFVPKSFLSSSDRFSNSRIYSEYILSDDKNNFNDYSFLIEERIISKERFITKKKIKKHHKEVEYKNKTNKEIVVDKLSKKPRLYSKAKNEEAILYKRELQKYGGSEKVVRPIKKKRKK